MGSGSGKPLNLLSGIKELDFTFWTMRATECYRQRVMSSDLNHRTMDARLGENWNVSKKSS